MDTTSETTVVSPRTRLLIVFLMVREWIIDSNFRMENLRPYDS